MNERPLSGDRNSDNEDAPAFEPSFLDRAIGWVSPKWRLQRELARTHLDGVQRARAYEAAKTSRLRKKREERRGPDVSTYESIVSLRAQARYHEENNDLAVSVLNTLVASVIGEGVRSIPQMRKRNGELATDANKFLGRLWRDWSEAPEVTWEFGWTDVQQLIGRSWFRDGEVFSQHVEGLIPGFDHGTRVPYSLELLEADMVPNGLNDPGRGIVQGVQKNAWGRPNVFYIHKHHPGNIIMPFGAVGLGLNLLSAVNLEDVKGIPAPMMTHLKMTNRIRQTRGVSVFASSFTRLQDLKEFEESERVAARIGAAFAFAITRSPDYSGDTVALSPSKLREVGLAPGIILDNMAPGESIESLKNERPNNQLATFREAMLRAVSGGTGASYSSMAKDYKGTWSSQRQELLESAVLYSVLRSRFISQQVDPTYRHHLDMAILSGEFDPRDFDVDLETVYNVEHRGRGIPYIDPRNESDSDISLIKAGLMSKTQTILKRGGDPEEVREQLAEERALDALAGLMFSTNLADEKVNPGLDKIAGAIETGNKPADEDEPDDAPEAVETPDDGAPEPESPDDDAPPADSEEAADDGAVQGTALNGAQIASMLVVIQSLADGKLPKETVVAVLKASFPLIDAELISDMVDSLEGFEAPAPDDEPPRSEPDPDPDPPDGEGGDGDDGQGSEEPVEE